VGELGEFEFEFGWVVGGGLIWWLGGEFEFEFEFELGELGWVGEFSWWVGGGLVEFELNLGGG
jgi:hypothetical protein